MSNYLAIDLGAESGRTILGTLSAGKLVLHETHRFANQPVRLPNALHWDILRLWAEIKTGIAATVKDGVQLDSLGVDTWGVDFVLLDKDGNLLANPTHYRDARTDGMLEEAFVLMPRSEIFANTGIQFMQLNTLYQLLAMLKADCSLFEIAKTFLTIPDLLNYWLSGKLTNEFTNATTTQCFNPQTKAWSSSLLDAMGIPEHLFNPISEPGTVLGGLQPSVAEETGAEGVQVVVPACHDTGSAVVAVPAENQDFAWLSSGTWSIMGAEVTEPVLGEKALEYNFTNEGGVFGTWRLSKNIMGLWIVQECRRTWQSSGQDYSYDAMTKLAAESDPFIAVINPDDDIFFHPGDMPQKIQSYCKKTGQRVPQSHGEILRVALESLALKYRWALGRLEELAGREFAPIHIIGGGTQNRLLNQFAANATGRMVVTGPIEATAIGNVLMQAIGMGHLESLADAREVVRNSFDVEKYYPAEPEGWDAAYEKLLTLL
ncbi:MAG: rhamnulokinase [Chloroflexi bacterium]|jgi:rhamnulokinase|nr:rhamnulokinase [Chloroflexota bacterium]